MNISPKPTDLTLLSDDGLEAKRRTYLLSRETHENGNTPKDLFLYIVACGWLDAIKDEWQRRLAAQTRNEQHSSEGQS